MTKARKVELLYKKAKGQSLNASAEELKEIRKYKIDAGEGNFHSTKANISEYITAVDNGCRVSFYDWCMNNKKADRRRKGSSEKEISKFNNEQNMSAMFIGWLTWGIAIYWMSKGQITVGASAIMGAIVSVILFKSARKWGAFTLLILPLVLASIFGK